MERFKNICLKAQKNADFNTINSLFRHLLGTFAFLLLLAGNAAFAQTVGGSAPADDFDGDGIVNSIDLDDDNDGILDAVECITKPNKILFAGSTEDFATMRSSLFNEFNNNKAQGATIVESNIIESATVPAGFYDGYDMVIFGGAAFNAIHPNHWAALTTAIQNKTSKSFIIQSDNCCVAGNQNGLVNLLNTVFGTNYRLSSANAASNEVFPLNQQNSYANLISTNSLVGNNYFPMLNVAVNDILFYSPTVSGSALAGMKQLPGTTDKNRFVAWFVDGTPTQGAPWYPTNQNKIATIFNDVYNATTPLTCDTDNDGVYNHLDLDSDGDGCSDALEGGATTSTTANFKFTGAVGANGFVNTLETTTDSDIPNYSLTYASYALTRNIDLCADFDGDGVRDFTDIDDDNDGVLDAVESPNCFYQSNEFTNGNRASTGILITTGIPMNAPYNVPSKLVDGDETIGGSQYAVQFVNGTSIVNREVYKFEFPVPIELTRINLRFVNTNSHFNAGTTIRVQGSNDNSNWTDLNTGATYDASTDNNIVAPFWSANTPNEQFSVTQNQGKYRYYRLFATAGAVNSNGLPNEVYFTLPTNYQASNNPKVTCTSDTDSDQNVNHRDLDSDGDGCADAIEAGSSTTATSTSVFPTGTDTNSNGLLNAYEGSTAGTVNYSSLYTVYGLSNLINACLDSDGDGVGMFLTWMMTTTGYWTLQSNLAPVQM